MVSWSTLKTRGGGGRWEALRFSLKEGVFPSLYHLPTLLHPLIILYIDSILSLPHLWSKNFAVNLSSFWSRCCELRILSKYFWGTAHVGNVVPGLWCPLLENTQASLVCWLWAAHHERDVWTLRSKTSARLTLSGAHLVICGNYSMTNPRIPFSE